MTYSGPPHPPAPPGGYGPPAGPGGWSPPPGSGGWGPPPGPGGFGPGGPPPSAKPPFPVWPVVVVTVLFALFGLIPTILGANRASERRESPSRYWIAFGVSLLASFVLYVVVFLVLTFLVFAGTVGAATAIVNSIPTDVPTFPGGTSLPSGSSTASTPAGACAYTPDGTVSNVSLPDADPSGVTATTWTLVTSAGTIVVALDSAAAPCTVNSIVHLTETGFYDNSPCPRSVNQGLSILQCGDPTGTGAGGPGYTFPDEDLDNADYAAGAVAMANAGPSTNGSQFFLMDQDQNSVLQKNYTVFGTITSGLDVLSAIVAAGNDSGNGTGDGKPTPPVSVVTATVS